MKSINVEEQIKELEIIVEQKKQEYIGAMGALNYLKSLLVEQPTDIKEEE